MTASVDGNGTVLVINCGSTSIKYKLFSDLDAVLEGEVTGIGTSESAVKHDGSVTDDRSVESHGEGMEIVVEHLSHGAVIDDASEIAAVGHRVVHGGEFREPRVIDESTKETIREFAPFAPLHNPVNLEGIEAVAEHLPGVLQVAVFDTAFHQTMPPEAFLYGLPYEYYEEHGIRRYGFHGISHAYVTRRACGMLARPVAETNLITCHLGGGCSVTAVEGGESVDTSMGFSPLEGVVMTTRSGDVDPTVVEFLVETLDMDLGDVLDVLNDSSGLAGLSGISGDMRELLAARDDGNERADLAIRTFAYSVKQRIGGYAATLGDVDALVFTGGIGTNVPLVRKQAGTLPVLGAEIDTDANENTVGEPGVISTDRAETDVVVVPTNEELRIARQTHALIE